MRWYLFLSRIAFVGNIFFAIFLMSELFREHVSEDLMRFIFSMVIFSIIANIVWVIASVVVMFINYKQLRPVWMIIINFIAFVVQAYQIAHIRIPLI